MRQKTILWFFSFAILICLNLFIVFTYIAKLQRVNASMRILDEIDHANDSLNQFGTPTGPQAVTYQTDVKLSDGRVANLKQFFRKYNSPLYDYADYMVQTSDRYQFDYRLLPAIAMQESGLCQNIPSNSFNCWGWGIYGNTVTRFSSYDEAISAVAKGVREQYIDKGLLTASAIMEKYNPSSNGSWAQAVNGFMRALE